MRESCAGERGGTDSSKLTWALFEVIDVFEVFGCIMFCLLLVLGFVYGFTFKSGLALRLVPFGGPPHGMAHNMIWNKGNSLTVLEARRTTDESCPIAYITTRNGQRE